jgi:hypothetical protein
MYAGLVRVQNPSQELLPPLAEAAEAQVSRLFAKDPLLCNKFAAIAMVVAR